MNGETVAEPFTAELVPFPVETHLPGLPEPGKVRAGLQEQFDRAVAKERERRGEVRRPSDTWVMVRAVEGFRTLVGDYARALTSVADDAKSVLEEELFEAHGEQDGIPNGPLQVPGDGEVITVKAKTQNEYDIDSFQVMAALAALEAKRWQGDPTVPDPADDPERFGMAVAMAALRMMGAADLKVTRVKALAMELGLAGEDGLSQVVSDAIRKRRVFKGIDVQHKDAS